MNDYDQRDCYQILNIDKNATQEQIKQAYRKLAFQYHPDKNTDDPTANAKMKKINEAYAILSDSGKRSEYDLLRSRYGAGANEQYRQAHAQGDIFDGSDIEQVFDEFARQFGYRGFSEIFREFHGAGFQTSGFRRSQNVGTDARWQDPPQATPPAMPLPWPMRFLVKRVFKRVTGIDFPERGKDESDTIKVNFQIALNGADVTYRCRRRNKTLRVKVPAGAKNGQRIRLKGMGGPGKGGAESGDLYLHVRIKHPLWQRIRGIWK